MKYYILFIFLTTNSLLISQTQKIDSLKSIINDVKQPDTIRILAKLKWAYHLRTYDLDSNKILTEQAWLASEKLNYTKGKAKAKRELANYFDEKGEKEKAITNYKEAIRFMLFRISESESNLLRICNSLVI